MNENPWIKKEEVEEKKKTKTSYLPLIFLILVVIFGVILSISIYDYMTTGFFYFPGLGKIITPIVFENETWKCTYPDITAEQLKCFDKINGYWINVTVDETTGEIKW